MSASTEEATGDEAVAELAANFREFGEITSRKMPLYRRLCLGAAADLDVVRRVFLAKPAQRRVNLLLAAVHDLVLSGEDTPLAAWYASMTEAPRAVGPGDDDPFPHFRTLVLEHPHVAERLATRSTQTNEVGRCAALLPAVAGIAAEAGRPVGLVDVGTSAGLNLLLDRYEYHYEPGGHVGGPSSVRLAAKVIGDRPFPVPTSMPPIASRVGLDLHPVDITDPAAVRWLVACQWPDQLERLERARGALEAARADPPRILQGDAVDDLQAAIATVPAAALPVVTSSWVMAYLPDDRQRAFIAQLDRVAARRDVSLVFAEAPIEVPGLPVPPGNRRSGGEHTTVLVRVDWRTGQRSVTHLANLYPHGTWIQWLA
ncbi:MAG: DUF2332 domain-containing protein [Actinomycetota bacterium]|nr:DUF2332 domain-containing protein [Actinomycetota bacterium]